jgi:hypothetical protein
MSEPTNKKPGKGARPTTLARRVQAAIDDLYPFADAVLIIACKTGTGSDMGETVVMRHAGTSLMMEGAVMRLAEGGELFAGMMVDAGSEDEDDDDGDAPGD